MAKKLHSLLMALCITLLILINYFYFTHLDAPVIREKVIVGRIIDGDTIFLMDNRTIRFLNVNSPEKSSILAVPAYNFLKKYENKTLEIEVVDTDIYNRSLAKVFSKDYLNLILVREGLASKFLVQKDELKLFDSAEKEAIQSERGIWKKSPYFGCLNVSIFQKEEVVNVINNCDSINLSGWIIKDESRKTLSLPAIEIGKLNIHSSNGISNSTDIFWNSSTSVWNDDRDTFYLFDERNRIVAQKSYGY